MASGRVGNTSPQQVGVDALPRLRHAGARLAVDGLQAHPAHQPPHPMATEGPALPAQVPTHLPTAVEGMCEVQLVDAPLQPQRLRARRPGPVVPRGAAHAQQPALLPQAGAPRTGPDQRQALRAA